jgi:TP901 family phage tail tape measure protein
MSDVTIVIKAQNQAQAAMQAVKGDLEQIGRTAGGLKQQLANAAAEMRNVGMGLTAGVTLPIVGIAAAAVNSAAQFEQSLNVMQQVSGATEAQMASMQAQALQLGAETAFSAGEAAAGMLELAKAGLDTDQVMAAIGGTMDLAAAGNLGLAQAAEIAANAVNTFGLDATQTVDVANMLAAAANASSVEVTDLASGMQMAGSVFASSGQDIDVLTTALALMGNAGIKGSDAGTSLKTMLMRLTAPTKEARAMMDQLNVSMYNLDGSTRDLPDVMADLQASMAGATDEARQNALTTIFGADAIRAVNVLLAKGPAGWKAMSKAVSAQGAASEVANARMSGMAGAIEYAKGSLDSFLIGGALPFLDTMSGVVRQAADALTWFGELDVGIRNAAMAFTAVLAAAGPVLLAFSGIAAAVGFLVSPIGLVVVGLGALAAAWTTNFGGIQEITAQAFRVIQPYLDDAREFLDAEIPRALSALQGAWDSTWRAVQGALGTAWGIIQPYLQSAYDWFQTAGPGALKVMQGAWDATWAALQTAVDTTWAVIGPYLQGALTWFQTDGPEALTSFQGTWETTWSGLQAAVDTGWAAVQESLSGALTWFQTDGPDALTAFQTAWDAAWNGLQAAASAAWTQLEALLTPALTRLQEAFAKAQADVGALGPKFDGLVAAVQNMWTAVQPVLAAFAMFVAGTIAVVSVLGVNLLAQTFNALGSVVSTVFDQITLTINTFSALVGESVTLIKAILEGDWKTAWDSAKGIVETFKTFFEETFNNLKSLAETTFGAIYKAVNDSLNDLNVDGQGILTGIQVWWDGIWLALSEKVKPVSDAVASAQAALTGFQEWIAGFTLPDALAGWSFLDLKNWTWPEFPAIPDIVKSLLAWGWPAFPAFPAVLSTLLAWGWPKFPEVPDWLERLMAWRWPTPPAILESAQSAAQGAMDAAGGVVGAIGDALNGPGNKQLGTSYYAGGPTWVGEAGRELLIPPRGSQIIPNRSAEKLAGAVAGAVDRVAVTVQQMIVRDDKDVYALAYQVAEILARG